MFCQTFSHLRDGQNSREARDKGNVSQQLRTTNTNAEPMRKASESDAAENVSLPGDATNSLSPGAQSRDRSAGSNSPVLPPEHPADPQLLRSGQSVQAVCQSGQTGGCTNQELTRAAEE